MNTVGLFDPEPVFQIQDLGGMLKKHSKNVTPTERGLLHGEVVSTLDSGLRVQLRDAGGAMVELKLEKPLDASRGESVEVLGAPELISETMPLALRVVWRGHAAKKLGVAKRFRERRALAERLASSLPFETPRIDSRLRGAGRLRVVTCKHSKAAAAVTEAARQYRWLKPAVCYYGDAGEPESLAAALTSLKGVISKGDVILVAHDAGEMTDFDLFEDQRVVEALATLTKRCATILAVGQAGDELLANKVVTYPVETAGLAIQLVLRESGVCPIEVLTGAPMASGDQEKASERPVVGRTGASRSKPRGAWKRWLLAGAAVFLGWWARGSHSPEQLPSRELSAVSSLANAPLLP